MPCDILKKIRSAFLQALFETTISRTAKKKKNLIVNTLTVLHKWRADKYSLMKK